MLLRLSILAERARARMSSRSRRAVAPDRGVLIAGRAMAEEYRKHWLIKDVREPNRFVRAGSGTRRTHFWRQIAQSLRLVSTKGNSVDMRVGDRRFRQKLYGGPIVAKVAKMLTIPDIPACGGMTSTSSPVSSMWPASKACQLCPPDVTDQVSPVCSITKGPPA